MTAMQRMKGIRGENELSRLLADELGVSVVRTLDQTRDGGADIHVGTARIQVKRCETLSVGKWWAQAEAEAGPFVPVLAYRQSRMPWRFRLRMADLHSGGVGFAELDLPAFCYVARELLLEGVV